LTSRQQAAKPIYIKPLYTGNPVLNVKTLCLGYLSLKEATGYEIKKDVEDGLFSHFIEASYGSIYPALNQLAHEGLVICREEEQSGKPDKKIYAITASGQNTLRSSLMTLPARDKYKSEFLFVMLLQHHLSFDQQRAAMEKQLADLKTDLQNIAHCRTEMPANPACDFVMGYGESVLTAGVSYLEQRLAEHLPSTKVAAE
jgi:PadR family transcriptional regulator, regulatory protein AphA